jgi:hypothetical protein
MARLVQLNSGQSPKNRWAYEVGPTEESRYKYVKLIGLVMATYLISWTVAYVAIMGFEVSYYIECLVLDWTLNAG